MEVFDVLKENRGAAVRKGRLAPKRRWNRDEAAAENEGEDTIVMSGMHDDSSFAADLAV